MTNQNRLEKLKKIAHFLDNQFEGPFGIRFGLDPLLGLIPLVGDLITLGYSLSILINAHKMGCSMPVLIRMTLNLMIEFLIEKIPFLGSIGDALWKANSKNISLLEKHLLDSKKLRQKSLFILVILVTVLLVFALSMAYVAYMALNWLISFFV